MTTRIQLSSLFCGVLALGLNYGAYGAEVVRGAINSVPKGQWEATTALSMNPARTMVKIIWPQAWAIMIPSLSNLLVMLFTAPRSPTSSSCTTSPG